MVPSCAVVCFRVADPDPGPRQGCQEDYWLTMLEATLASFQAQVGPIRIRIRIKIKIQIRIRIRIRISLV